ncbi:MAG: hypothetical protein RMJ19_06200, partial [Gemmatales bacterium]|nr:hypothetical protein [Gemmatales bacterium]MDW8175245.1 hypothetical protein [Gemmatales bacterium]
MARSQVYVWAFMLFFPLMAALLYFVVFSGSAWAKPTYILTKLVQFGFPIFYVHLVRRQGISVRAPQRKDWLAGSISGLALAGVILTAYFAHYRAQEWMGQVSEQIWAKLQELGANSRLKYIGLALFLSVIHALLEEYYWRWFVWSELARRWPSWLAIII